MSGRTPQRSLDSLAKAGHYDLYGRLTDGHSTLLGRVHRPARCSVCARARSRAPCRDSGPLRVIGRTRDRLLDDVEQDWKFRGPGELQRSDRHMVRAPTEGV